MQRAAGSGRARSASSATRRGRWCGRCSAPGRCASSTASSKRDLGLPLALEAGSGKLFPASNRARDVRDGLVGRARAAGVTLRFATTVTAAHRRDGGWLVTHGGRRAAGRRGWSSPPADCRCRRPAATDLGLDLARALGHVVQPTYAALTPLTGSAGRRTRRCRACRSTCASTRRRPASAAAAAAGSFSPTAATAGRAVLDVSHVAVRSQWPGPAPATVRVAWTSMDAAAWRTELAELAGRVSDDDRTPPARSGSPTLLVREAGVPEDRTCVQLRREERTALLGRSPSTAAVDRRRGLSHRRGHRRRRGARRGAPRHAGEPAHARASTSAARSSTPSVRSAATTSAGRGPPGRMAGLGAAPEPRLMTSRYDGGSAQVVAVAT